MAKPLDRLGTALNGDALVIQEELLQMMGEMAMVGGWEFDAQTGAGSWTPEVARIHDLDPELEPNVELGLNFFEGVHREKIEKAVKEAVELAKPYDLELELTSAKGRRKWIRTMAMPLLKDGKVVKVRGIFQDITDRKRTEDALRDREEKLHLFIQNAPAAIAIFDTEMRYLAASRRWLSDYGLGGRNILGLSHYEVFPDIPERWREIHRKCLAGAVEKSDEDTFPREDGTVDWVRWEIHPWRTPEGRIGGIIIFSEVITARKLAELELEKLNLELEERVLARTADLEEANRALAEAVKRAKSADRAKSGFIASMSHELRTPLNSVLGFTGAILGGLTGEISKEQREALEIVQRSGKHLLALITDLLDLSKIEAGAMAISREPCDVRELAMRAVETIASLASSKGLDLRFIAAPDSARVSGDRRRISQIILNLLSNAVKFTESGAVTVSLSREESGGSCVRCSVTDTGAGIAEADLPRLFRKFEQISTGMDPSHDGAGLGLAVSQELAKLMGGEISVKSLLGEGSTFTLSLPADDEIKAT